MIRAGFTDAALDQECRDLLDALEVDRAAEAGVEQVLLLSLQVGGWVAGPSWALSCTLWVNWGPCGYPGDSCDM
jgi:hypothetical protein